MKKDKGDKIIMMLKENIEKLVEKNTFIVDTKDIVALKEFYNEIIKL